jgi:hypothetical protein
VRLASGIPQALLVACIGVQVAGWLCTIWSEAGMVRHMSWGKVVALPSTPFRALFNGIGFKTIGVAVP